MKTKLKYSVGALFLHFAIMSICAQTVNIEVKVLDQKGNPVAGVIVDSESMSYLRKKHVGEILYEKKTTNDKGLVTLLSRKNSMTERIYLNKEDYYESRSMTLAPMSKNFPPSTPIELKIKAIKNPIAMYAKKIDYLSVPVDGRQVGYDIMIGDWVAPHGRGKTSDLLFKHEGVRKWSGPKHYKEAYEQKITIGFKNEKDGLLPYKGSSEDGWKYGSEFTSMYEAPLEGYQKKWVQRTWKEKGGAHKTTRDIDRNFYFRVRTKVDSKGNIISAYYGKIYGDFMTFSYYLNPTSRDKNVEFDPKRNLFKNQNIKRP